MGKCDKLCLVPGPTGPTGPTGPAGPVPEMIRIVGPPGPMGPPGPAGIINTKIYSNDTSSNGVYLSPRTIGWNLLSTPNLRENLVELNNDEVLEKVEALAIYQFNLKGHKDTDVCRGPIPEQWNYAFPTDSLPETDVNVEDMIAICLSSIKALRKKVKELELRLGSSNNNE